MIKIIYDYVCLAIQLSLSRSLSFSLEMLFTNKATPPKTRLQKNAAKLPFVWVYVCVCEGERK